ncbi:hypothetical protein BDW75DRAFT_82942 [Aspergillus navahoensis]
MRTDCLCPCSLLSYPVPCMMPVRRHYRSANSPHVELAVYRLYRLPLALRLFGGLGYLLPAYALSSRSGSSSRQLPGWSRVPHPTGQAGVIPVGTSTCRVYDLMFLSLSGNVCQCSNHCLPCPAQVKSVQYLRTHAISRGYGQCFPCSYGTCASFKEQDH